MKRDADRIVERNSQLLDLALEGAMAWDEFERDGKKLMSGDDALDELSLSLRRIAEAYEQHFHRLPFLDEVLLSLERVVGVSPERFFEDPHGLDLPRFECRRTTSEARQRLDFRAFEGYFADRPAPGHYGIMRAGVDVVKVPRLAVINRTLFIDYQVLDPALTDEAAVRLIKRVLLRVFSDSAYASEADVVVWRNLVTGGEASEPYTEH